MRKVCRAAAFSLFLLPMLARAQSPFDGIWKWEVSQTDWSKKPDVYVVQSGMYQCLTCVPPINIKADGMDQKVAGHPYFDTMAVKVINDHEIEETKKKDGKVVMTNKVTVSPDGNTMTFDFSDSTATNGTPITGKGEAVRVAKEPASANAVSGSWRMTKLSNMSNNGVEWTYKVNGDELTMSNPTGQSFTAKMDGTKAAFKGDPGITTVAIRQIGQDMIEETDERQGRVIAVIRSTVSADGRTVHIIYNDTQTGQTSRFTATKQ